MLVELARLEIELIEEAVDIIAMSYAQSAEDGPVNGDDALEVALEIAQDTGERERILRLLAVRFQELLLVHGKVPRYKGDVDML